MPPKKGPGEPAVEDAITRSGVPIQSSSNPTMPSGYRTYAFVHENRPCDSLPQWLASAETNSKYQHSVIYIHHCDSQIMEEWEQLWQRDLRKAKIGKTFLKVPPF
ncbi:Golgi-Associated Kinase 1B [Manis pentadactyla]|nr:Golgi-Associated Kinase 1B [Manis pentadactyla]